MSLVWSYAVHTTNIYHVFITNVTSLQKKHPPIQIAFTHKNRLHTDNKYTTRHGIDNKYTTRQDLEPVHYCSRDTASPDHTFPSGLLATPTMVLKAPRGRCVHRVSALTASYFQPLNGT